MDTLLRAGLDAAPGALLITDSNDQVILCNKSFREIWSIPDDTALDNTSNLISLINRQILNDGDHISANFDTNKSPFTLEMTDGRLLVGRFWTGGENESCVSVWQFHEVVGRFAQIDARLRDFAHLASDYFWETDSDGKFTFVSEQYEEITGISTAQVMGKTRAEIWTEFGQPDHELNQLNLAKSEEHVARREEYSGIQVEWRRHDGQDLILSMTGKPIYEKDGTYIGYRGVANNVTADIRRMEELRHSEARLRDLLNSSPVGVSIVAQESGKRLYVNRAFAEIIGSPSTESLIGESPMATWADPTDRQRIVSSLKNNEDITDYEHRRRRLDGSEVWVLMNSRRVEFAGEAATMYWFIDITARRETERLVRESELRLRTILDDSPVAISVIPDGEERREFANKAFIELMGAATLDEALAVDTPSTWVDPDVYRQIDEIITAGGNLDNFEGLRRRIDGREFPCSVTSRAMLFGGKPARVYWAIDLTEQRRAEEGIRQSEERLRNIVESSPIGFAVVEKDTGRRLFANQQILDMFGETDRGHFLDRPVEETWVDVSQLERIREIVASDDVVNFEAERWRADGSKFWALINARPMSYEDKPARLIWMTDITERVNSEASIRRSEQNIRAILESSPLGITIISREHSQRLFANQAMADMFGASSPSDMMGVKVAASWLSHESHMEARSVLRSDAGFVNYETRRKRSDGSTLWCLQNSSVVEFEGEQAWVIWHNDITNIKVQQQAFLQAKEEADAANRAKSEFLSSMSHELRTPLNAVLGFAQLLQMTPASPLTENQNSNVEQILRGGRHLLGLIDQVLDLAKIEGGQMDLDIGPVTVDAALLECRNLVQTTADRGNIQLILDPSCEDPETVAIADPTRLRQVVLNLLSNAIKYNRDGGSVTVSCRDAGDGMLRISVADTGGGIPRDQWSAVFEPFSRLGAETTEIEGTGIGLTLSKELIEKMGGRIGFTSEVDVGTTFWITIPLAQSTDLQEEEDAMDDNEALSVRSEGIVLYVEDNPANLQLVELIFEHLDGLKLISAPTGEVGVEMTESQLPDVVLMDIRLPGIDGFEALRRIRANPKTRHIPVVALSADAMPENVVQGKAAGFVDYLTKPLNVGRLVEVINEALEQTERT